jgi:hypothetical protein
MVKVGLEPFIKKYTYKSSSRIAGKEQEDYL